MTNPEPLAYLKEWIGPDGDKLRRVDLTDYLEPWLKELHPMVIPLYAATPVDGEVKS